MLIIILSSPTKDSLIPNNNKDDISLDEIADGNSILDKANMIEDGRQHMRKLLEYTMSNHISSVNLIASISVLSSVAKQRPEYMKLIIESLVALIG
jgi:hypothetical protein